MRLRRFAVAVLAIGLVVPVAARGEDEQGRLPLPEPGFAEPILAGPCTPQNAFDMPDYYGAKCKRLKFSYGPILAEPGTNDLLIQPTTIEQPRYNGYMVRWRPGLVDVIGAVPPVEQLHLHHGTWLGGSNYGSSPFFATGEEQTIMQYPEGYGQRWGAADPWVFLHMIHNGTSVAKVVYVTYDIDFIKEADANALGLKNTKSVWLDVGSSCGNWAGGGSGCSQYSLNPIFNIQRGFGHADHGSFFNTFNDGNGRRVCYFPKENCARFNSAGGVSAQQGIPRTNVKGWDWTVSSQHLQNGVGTIVVMGGHLHPGGIRDEVSLVRTIDGVEVEKPIHISDAMYWNHQNPTLPNGPVTSWDVSMTGTTKRIGWAVKVKAGDKLRLNGVYDTEVGSWYEQMGIVMAWIAPGDTSGVDPFDPDVVLDPGFPTTAVLPATISATCSPGFDGNTGKTTLCLRGSITHGSQTSRQNHALCTTNCPALTSTRVSLPRNPTITIAGFGYGVADMGVAQAAGIPQVRLGDSVTFVNADSAINVWHSVTRCADPCTGPTSTNYPLADGGQMISGGDPLDFDSTTLGVGVGSHQKTSWTWTPPQAGVFTFWCRIHPGMRGVIEVAT